jgi:hypothetical protein
VLPEYQSKAVTAIIFKEYYETFTRKGIINCIRTPELANNSSIYGNILIQLFRKKKTKYFIKNTINNF